MQTTVGVASIHHRGTCTDVDIFRVPKAVNVDLEYLALLNTCQGCWHTSEDRRFKELYQFINLDQHIDGHLKLSAEIY